MIDIKYHIHIVNRKNKNNASKVWECGYEVSGKERKVIVTIWNYGIVEENPKITFKNP